MRLASLPPCCSATCSPYCYACSIPSPSCLPPRKRLPSLHPATLRIHGARLYFMYVMGIFQLTCYRLGNVPRLSPGTSVAWVGWCRHHRRLVSAGEISGDGPATARLHHCPAHTRGEGQPQLTLSWKWGSSDRPSDAGAPPARQCQGQHEHLPLANTSPSNHLPLSVAAIGLSVILFILVSCDDNIVWRALQTREHSPYPEDLLCMLSKTETHSTEKDGLCQSAYGREVPLPRSWRLN